MNFFRYLGFLALVTFISGSIVAMAAKEIVQKLGAPSEAELASASKLVNALRGDELFAGKGRYAESQSVPIRSKGGLLPDYDMKRIKGFLVKQLASEDSPSAEATPENKTSAKPAEAGKY